jgi:hypothetical protein
MLVILQYFACVVYWVDYIHVNENGKFILNVVLSFL